MNAKLQAYARQMIKEGLAKLPEWRVLLFKRYHGSMDMPVDAVVDQMPEDKLDWAMQQVENSLEKQAADENAG